MIKHLITGGCSFSIGGNTHGWVGCLSKYLLSLNHNLSTDHTAEISQGQELIQKKVSLAIIDALDKGFKPEEILVVVMWSGIYRKAWYIDNPTMIQQMVNDWQFFPSGCSTQFIDLKYYEHNDNKNLYKKYVTKNSYGAYNPSGGWYFTTDGSDNSIEGIKEYYLLDDVGKVHSSLENIIMLQNLCKLKGIKFMQQIFMTNIYDNFLKYKDHQLVKYLFNQLDIKNFINYGKFDFTLSHYNLKVDSWLSMEHSRRNEFQQYNRLFESDNFHPNEKASNLYFNEILFPNIIRILND